VWRLLLALSVSGPAEQAALAARFDELRADYVELYAEAEAVAQSSAAAAARVAARRASVPSARLLRALRGLPLPIRHALPLRGRIAIARALRRLEPRRLVAP
jgi:hypothetical protein